jgi:hypothetical protein
MCKNAAQSRLLQEEPRAKTSAEESRGAARWYALVIFTFGYALNIGDRYVDSTLIEPIKAEMGLSDTAVGFLTGVSLATASCVLKSSRGSPGIPVPRARPDRSRHW